MHAREPRSSVVSRACHATRRSPLIPSSVLYLKKIKIKNDVYSIVRLTFVRYERAIREPRQRGGHVRLLSGPTMVCLDVVPPYQPAPAPAAPHDNVFSSSSRLTPAGEQEDPPALRAGLIQTPARGAPAPTWPLRPPHCRRCPGQQLGAKYTPVVQSSGRVTGTTKGWISVFIVPRNQASL